jgi:hypothetical protein
MKMTKNEEQASAMVKTTTRGSVQVADDLIDKILNFYELVRRKMKDN